MTEPIVLASVLLGAVSVLITCSIKTLKFVRKGVHKFDRLEAVLADVDERTARELDHNHGSSMKDDTHGVAISVGVLQRDQDALRDEIESVRRELRAHINDSTRRNR